VPELEFQHAAPEVQLTEHDAHARGIRNGETVNVRSYGIAVPLRARLTRELRDGVVRIAEEHAGELQPLVEVSK
jgi:anaerobic selenocysteine-containing dehydrogenase